ncbi:MerR family transcriptional regulator [Moritella sp. F3]|uniref:MerR family transcriptional regulator n=1 Tax=Moritella sp. F3 TaxID=2718882 RepID=UPI0018E12B4E|nr:MerR family transcriptional regulator [Moritella sp. F3]GIC76906.1 MerR family transcriptional regulator [Moritella sp. F1]GIC80089.1 MerR family transcriptional regulator [Moritella sp. F3]
MLTVTQLANACHISRTTLLYYERAGLLLPALRSDNGYRWYGDKEVKRLESIISYRSFGLSIKDIMPLLDNDLKQEQTLHNQFNALEKEIQVLRLQQKAIVMLLEQPALLATNQLTKARWVGVMRNAGFDEEDMSNWHKQFEKMEPGAHQEFLESLNIDADEIELIRNMSKV